MVRETARPHGSKQPDADPAARIEATIASIPRGCVASYGQVAAMAGLAGRARLVARVLRITEADLPWHRVLRSDGSIGIPVASPGHAEQKRRLQDEGVVVTGSRVNLRAAGWDPIADLIARDLLGLQPDD